MIHQPIMCSIGCSMPGELDVVCGGSRMYHFHSGNKRFRQLIERNLQVYMNESKAGKSALISFIVDSVRKNSTAGGFVQKDPLNGTFVSVSDHHAREKTSQTFRDALHCHYKSSNFSKKQRRFESRRSKKSASFEQDQISLLSMDRGFVFTPQKEISNLTASYPSNQFLDVDEKLAHSVHLMQRHDETIEVDALTDLGCFNFTNKINYNFSAATNESYMKLNTSLPADFFDDSRHKVVINPTIYRRTSSSSRSYCDDENAVHNFFEEVNELPTASELCNFFTASNTKFVGLSI